MEVTDLVLVGNAQYCGSLGMQRARHGTTQCKQEAHRQTNTNFVPGQRLGPGF